jgi:hypothetical protein
VCMVWKSHPKSHSTLLSTVGEVQRLAKAFRGHEVISEPWNDVWGYSGGEQEDGLYQ